MRSFVARHRLAAFLALAFPLSWYPWLIAIAHGRTTGPNPLGPLVAALVVTGISGGFKDLLASIVRVRVAWWAYAFAVGVPIVMFALASTRTAPLAWKDVVDRFLFIFLFVALGEEPGWRGFALPELEQHFSATKASLILAGIWTVWHVPLFGNEFAWPIVPAFAISVAGVTLVMTWLAHKTSGSVLIPMLMHATVNTISGGATVHWWIYAALWALAGFIVSRSALSKIVLPSPHTSHVLVDLGSGRPRASGH